MNLEVESFAGELRLLREENNRLKMEVSQLREKVQVSEEKKYAELLTESDKFY